MEKMSSSTSLVGEFFATLFLTLFAYYFLVGGGGFVAGNILLPDVPNVDSQLATTLGVDNFFTLWRSTFRNGEGVQISDQPFTIFAPTNTAKLQLSGNNKDDHIKEIILDHLLLGSIFDVTNTTKESAFETSRGRLVFLRRKEEKTFANGAQIIQVRKLPKGMLVVLDGYLFPEEYQKKNTTQGLKVKEEIKGMNESFIEDVLQVLSFLKSGVRVFQHFLSRSNASALLQSGEEYTVFVPTDHAFHRWHPIDWGFYPFSVPEFTENVIINHFVRGNRKQGEIKDGDVAKTLGGQDVVFRTNPSLTVNGVTVVKGDTPIPHGNIIFTAEVLFVNESVVSRLHQQHRDKETPPLLAFPWFGAQFLSHAFLALERDIRFTHIARFLNLADLAPHVSGTGYTFFVPIDQAFEQLGLHRMPDNYLSNGEGLQILLNHFVKGRLYDRDLRDGGEFTTLGNNTIRIARNTDQVKVNEATVVESEVFVYNLGTMFYIDKILFVQSDLLPNFVTPSSTTSSTRTTASTAFLTTPEEIETVPDEIIEEGGSHPDLLTELEQTTIARLIASSSTTTEPINSTLNGTIK